MISAPDVGLKDAIVVRLEFKGWKFATTDEATMTLPF